MKTLARVDSYSLLTEKPVWRLLRRLDEEVRALYAELRRSRLRQEQERIGWPYARGRIARCFAGAGL